MRRDQRFWMIAFVAACGSTAAAAELPTYVVADPDNMAKPPSNTRILRSGKQKVLEWQMTKSGLNGVTFRLDQDPSKFDRVRFRYRIQGKGCTWFGIKIIHKEYSRGQQYVWPAFQGKTPPEGWREVAFDLHDPPVVWSRKVTDARVLSLRAMTKSPRGLRAQVSAIRLTRSPFSVSSSPPTSPPAAAPSWQARFRITSKLDSPVTVLAKAVKVSGMTCSLSGSRLTLAPRESSDVSATVTLQPGSYEPLQRFRQSVTFEAVGYTGSRQEHDLDLAMPLPKRPHPFLTLTRDDVQKIKAKAKKHPWAKGAYDAVLKSADKLLEAELRVPDQQGQWGHFYSCSACGSRLRTKSPTRHVCRKCGREYSGEPYDRVPITSAHHRLGRNAFTLGLAYQFTGDARYAKRAKGVLMQYADKYLEFPYRGHYGKPNRGGRVIATVLSESTWLIPVAQAYDLIADSPIMAERDRQTVATKLLRPAALICRAKGMGIHNISCWRNAAIGLSALAIGDAELASYAINSKSGIKQQIAEGIQDDGVWFENSWGYHFYALSPLCYLAQACHNIGIDVFNQRFKGMFDAPLLFAMPNGRLPAFNDSGSGGSIFAYDRYEVGYQRYGEPRYFPVLARTKRRSWQALLYGQPLPAKAPAAPAESRNFPSSGVLVLRSGQGTDARYLALDYGPHGGGHGHPDKLGFVSCGFGQILGVDPGSISYAVPLHGEWFKRSLSHNLIVVDQKDQSRTTGKLEFHTFGTNAALAHADAGGAYPGVRVTRTVAMHEDTFIVVDRAVSEREHTYDWVYHNRGDLTTEADMKPYSGKLGKPDPYLVPKDVRTASVCGSFWATWKLKDISVPLTLYLDRETTVFTALAPGQPPTEMVPMLLARQKAKSATFPWAFSMVKAFSKLKGKASPLTLEKLAVSSGGRQRTDSEAIAIRVRGEQRSYLLAVNFTEQSIEFLGHRLDGRAVLAVGEGDGWKTVLGVDVSSFDAR